MSPSKNRSGTGKKNSTNTTTMSGFSGSQWIAVLLLPVVTAALWLYIYQLVRTVIEPIHDRNVCLLVAHPDDEAMFFAPTLLALSKPELGNTISVICFSSGDADGLGEIRKKELVRSCERLGIPSANTSVSVIEHELLPDSMTKNWPSNTISSLLSAHLSAADKSDIDTLITFDRDGVSSHPNHISLLYGAKKFIADKPHEHPVLLYTLTSVALHRKYISIFDGTATLLMKYLFGRAGWGGEGAPREALFVSGWNGYRTAQKAMVEGHESQMRWFRWGWIAFSRYMVINDLKLQDVV